MDEIKELWDANRGYDAGVAIVATIPPSVQPRWAARILRLVLSKSGVDDPAIDHVLAVADSEVDWWRGHDAFSKVREHVLLIEDSAGPLVEDQLFLAVLLLAECVAKVTYNATLSDDPFDEDTGAWIVLSLRNFVENWKDDEQFAAQAYEIGRNQS